MYCTTEWQGVASSASAARPTSDLDLNGRRIAWDGKAYAFSQFADYYGFTPAVAVWQQCACQASAEQSVRTAVSHFLDQNSAPLAGGIVTSSVRTVPLCLSAEQCVDTTAGHSQGYEVCLSWNQLVAMPSIKGFGGKAACVEQKRLREHCFANNLWEYDLTDTSTYQWPQLLKGMSEAQGMELVGSGVVKFCFRLLQNVRDHNYRKNDSGQRHVFEIVCTDGRRWQLHYHKNGRMDKPILIPTTLALHSHNTNNASGEEGHTWHCQDILHNAFIDNLPVGRNETSTAMAIILRSHSPQEFPFAVDITATSAFPWQRWLRNVSPLQSSEIVGIGIVKVFAFCFTAIPDTQQSQKAQIVFCHPDDTYTLAKPGNKLEYQQLAGWRDCPPFKKAPVHTTSWMEIQA